MPYIFLQNNYFQNNEKIYWRVGETFILNLKNYNFLCEEDLKSKINSLKELGVSINSNIEVLNSDINIIKRIKLCNSLGISIYDENNKIKKDILNKDLFFVPDSKIDEYVNERTLVLN